MSKQYSFKIFIWLKNSLPSTMNDILGLVILRWIVSPKIMLKS